VFEGHTPGDAVRCPVDGCAFAGAVGQVVSHVVGTDDGDHDAVEREIDRARTSAESPEDADRTPAVEELVRLLEAAHGTSEGYESDRGGGWLFPFEDT
jgi:hypothetical protein